jgi:hypothetical protein
MLPRDSLAILLVQTCARMADLAANLMEKLHDACLVRAGKTQYA